MAKRETAEEARERIYREWQVWAGHEITRLRNALVEIHIFTDDGRVKKTIEALFDDGTLVRGEEQKEKA